MLKLDLRAVAATLAARPEAELTMAAVAAELGVAKPTLYRMAGSKAALIDACLDAEAERLLDHLRDADGAGGVLASVERYAEDSPGGFALLFERRAAGADVRVKRVESRLAGLLRCDELTAAEWLGAAGGRVSRARWDSGG